jgi:hypothetical protein
VDVESGTVVHAYGIVPAGAHVDLPGTGVGGARVAVHDAGSISALFSILPSETYGDAAWQQHADDPRWLTAVATEHQRVLSDVVQATDVLPLRLPAMYRDETRLHDMLTADEPLLRAALDALHDHVEWAVHLYYTGEPERPGPRPASGAEFLRQKAEAAAQREGDRATREQRVREAYAALADLSRQSVVNSPQDPTLSGRREPMLLNSAHLVCRRHERLFFAAVDETAARLAPSGISVEITGPWPPYNFVDLGAGSLEART